VAIIYGQEFAGQHGKRVAAQRATQIVRISLIGMMVAGLVGGLIVAAYCQQWFGPLGWIKNHVWFWAIIECGILSGIWAGDRWWDRTTTQLAKDSVTWMQGGHGEELVARYLNDLPDTWHVFHNVKILDRCDLDHVLIGPGGVFCISTKTNRGSYTVGPDGRYFLNDEETNHIRQSIKLAMELRDRMKAILGEVPWIQAVLMAPISYIEFNTIQDHVWVLHEENLRNGFFQGSQEKLSNSDIEQCAKAVKAIADRGNHL
jgi:hypothetical protein